MCTSRISPPPAPPLTRKSLFAEICTIFKLAWPQSTTQLTSFAPGLVLLAVVGHLENGAVLVGAAGIAAMYANFAHKMLLVSTTFGATPLFSQAFGAGNHRRLGLVLMRVMMLHVLMACCLAVPMTAVAGAIFSSFGMPAAVVGPAQTFLWIRLAGMPGLIVWFDVAMFLQAQRCVKLPMVVMVGGALAQAGLVYALATPSAFGFVGAPWAMTLVELCQGAVLLVAAPWLMRRERLGSWPDWWGDLRRGCEGWAEIITRGAPACVLVMSEWGGWECTLFVASGLYDAPNVTGAAVEAAEAGCPAIEAIPICTTIFVCQFLVAFGPGLAANVRVGNLLGEGKPHQARFCARVAFSMAMLTQAALTVAILSQREIIAAAFVADTRVQAHMVALLPYTTAYSFLATSVSGFAQQLLFGLGARLRCPAALNFVAFLGVGVPVGALLAYKGNLGEEGLWLGLLLAMLLALVGQYGYLARCVDWDEAARVARERALQDGQAATGSCGSASGTARGGTLASESDKRGLAAADSAAEMASVGS